MATVGHSGMLPGERGVTDFNLESLSPRSLLIELTGTCMCTGERGCYLHIAEPGSKPVTLQTVGSLVHFHGLGMGPHLFRSCLTSL